MNYFSYRICATISLHLVLNRHLVVHTYSRRSSQLAMWSRTIHLIRELRKRIKKSSATTICSWAGVHRDTGRANVFQLPAINTPRQLAALNCHIVTPPPPSPLPMNGMEYAGNELCCLFGLSVTPCRAFQFQSGSSAFVTEIIYDTATAYSFGVVKVVWHCYCVCLGMCA